VNTVDNNPKARVGALKVPLQYLPTVGEAYTALVLEHGANKYGPFNWRKEAISISTYVGAIRRHVGAIADGQDLDEDTGLPHWAHIAASCFIALDALSLGKLIDDRTKGMAPEVLAALAAARKGATAPAECHHHQGHYQISLPLSEGGTAVFHK
jgi:hypothetical protein